MEVKGHKLEIEREWYGDELEGTYFNVTKPNGETIQLDWSGWGDQITEEYFLMWIELDYPDRNDEALEQYRHVTGINVYSPLNINDLQLIERFRRTGGF